MPKRVRVVLIGLGRVFRVNNQYQLMPFYAETKRPVAQGEFGRAFYLQAWQQMFHRPGLETNWLGPMSQYVLLEFGTHVLDLACVFFDAFPDSLHSVTPRSRLEFDSDLLAHVTLRFPNDRLAVFSFKRITRASGKYLEMRLHCEEASIRMSLGGVPRFNLEWSCEARRPILRAGLLKGGEARVENEGRIQVLCRSAKSQFASATAVHLRIFLNEMQARSASSRRRNARGPFFRRSLPDTTVRVPEPWSSSGTGTVTGPNES